MFDVMLEMGEFGFTSAELRDAVNRFVTVHQFSSISFIDFRDGFDLDRFWRLLSLVSGCVERRYCMFDESLAELIKRIKGKDFGGPAVFGERFTFLEGL